MSSPYPMREHDSMQLVPAGPAGDGQNEGMNQIPRRLMRVKVLYTFDDQNKSNCLARLPGALNIPTFALDETTELGVMELKACIQAIVTASPELVAKLGHDYTVYAYDYSEYETPLVGQGMLSWILASASPTPNAPAEESQTMVTGRVCKNILGIFSNGIKETLEVKLKLVPVPTCMQSEYVENMERYHSLSRVLPEGLDYKEWADFLKSNPHIAQLAHSGSQQSWQGTEGFRGARRGSVSHMDAAQPMLTHPSHSADQARSEQPQLAYNSYGTRPSSPALSTVSFSHYQPPQHPRPASQASFRSEAMAPTQPYLPTGGTGQEQQEEGPPKKRARVTKASRPKKAPLGAKTDSLRVAASTAASVRLHRPTALSSAADVSSMDQVPRAPTPRPGDRSSQRPPIRTGGPAPSLLRHASVDEGRAYRSPYEPHQFSDAAADSADEERGNSPGETPLDIPSSPPVMQRVASSAPSSPGLPSLSYPADSGFVSDMPLAGEDDDIGSRNKHWDGSDLPTIADTNMRRKRDNSHLPWTEVRPGPIELLPTSFLPKPKAYHRPSQSTEKASKAPDEVRPTPRTELSEKNDIPVDPQLARFELQAEYGNHTVDGSMTHSYPHDQQATDLARTMSSVEPHLDNQLQEGYQNCHAHQTQTQADPRVSANPTSVAGSSHLPHPSSRASTPNAPGNRAKPSKSRGLPRSQTWSGEPMSDAISEGGSRLPRSGSGARRKQTITEQLQKSLAEGLMPAFCNHCGEIETPTWRKAYTRVEIGLPTDVQLSSDGTGIIGFEVIEASEDDGGAPKYRIFKQALDKVEKEGGSFQQLNLCNPCGLWLNKKNAMRPRELWAKKPVVPSGEKPKRKRNPRPRKKPVAAKDEIQSDAAIPQSEPVMRGGEGEHDGPRDISMPEPTRYRSCSTHLPDNGGRAQMDDATAMAAFDRAIQSSPGALGTTKDSPIDLEPDLTPKPTRRLLFPSPRRSGQAKSLADGASSVSPTGKSQLREAGKPSVQLSGPDAEDFDKENCPPSGNHDDLADLFEEHVSAKTTPTKEAPFQDLLKTPTPGSRRRPALSAKRGADINANPGLTTPSRNVLTPNRGARAATLPPETPFTRQLNAMLSEGFGSPSQAIDFSAFSPFSLTPGRGGAFADYNLTSDFLSSDLPMPSSPPGGLGFSVFEDPTSTVGLWSGASIFENGEGVAMETQDGHGNDQKDPSLTNADISVEVAAMAEGVVGGENGNEQGKSAEVAEATQGAA